MIKNERDRLYYSNIEKDKTIAELKEEIKFKDKKINKLEIALNKVSDIIAIIKNMNLKNKLRLGVCMSSSAYTKLNYSKAHIHSVFDKKLKEIDNDYSVSYVNMRKYPTILFVMVKIMEMNNKEQNQIAMYLFNSI